ncbi:MAG: hypothetical protein WDM79_08930 [Terricaulis sp.]
MTLDDLRVLGGSAAVIAFMVGVSALLGFRKSLRIGGADELAHHLAEYEPDARIQSAFIESRGRTALALLTDGRLLVVRVVGDRVSLRAFAASAVKLHLRADRLSATFGDVGFPALNIPLKDEAPPAWLAELADRKGAGEKQ